MTKKTKQNPICLFPHPVFDQLDVISYEEVVQLPAFNRKTLVLIGEYLKMTHITRNAVLKCWPKLEQALI